VIAVDNQGAATRIAHLLHEVCPLVPVFARAYDRRHAMDLIKAGAVDPIRETFESALRIGADVMQRLGAGDNRIADAIADARRRDAERFALQLAGDVMAGRELMLSNVGTAMENSG
jgi:glutathione-regulated potassium-efflux system protein KefB